MIRQNLFPTGAMIRFDTGSAAIARVTATSLSGGSFFPAASRLPSFLLSPSIVVKSYNPLEIRAAERDEEKESRKATD